MKGIIGFAIGAAASALALGLLFSGYFVPVSFDDVWLRIRKTDPGLFALGCLVFLINYPGNTLRFRYVFHNAGRTSISFWRLLPVVWASAFFSLILPTSVLSDATRVGMMKYLNLSSVLNGARTVILDRASGLFFLLVLCGAALFFIVPDGRQPIHFQLAGFAIMIVVAVSYLIVVRGQKLDVRIRFLSPVASLLRGFADLMMHREAFLVLMVFALVNCITFSFCLWFVAKSIHIVVPLWALLLGSPMILVASNIPIFYQGFGAREYVMVLLLGPLSASSVNELVSLALLSGCVLWVTAAVGCVFLPHIFAKRTPAG